MANILKKYKKDGVIEIGSDKAKLDTPEFEIIDVKIDTVNQVLSVEILHEAMQGAVKNPHKRFIEVSFATLPNTVKVAGKQFLDAIETKILELPQYSGAVEI